MVVLGRNIIRSGLSLILAFAALAGIYVLLGATLVAAAQVLVYIGAISVLILFADHAHPDQGRTGRAWCSTTRPGRPAGGHRRRSACCSSSSVRHRLAAGDGRAHRPERAMLVAKLAVQRLRASPSRSSSLLLLAAVDRRRLPRAPRRRSRSDDLPAPATRRSGEAMSHSLEAYLVLSAHPVRHRHLRLPRPAQRHRDADVASS